MKIERVGVIGCGTMGSGICEVVARAGLPVSFVEVSPEAVERGLARIAASLERAVDRGRLDNTERDVILERIQGDVDYKVLADADLVVEAVPEQLPVKQDAMDRVGRVLKPDGMIGSNTSSLSVIDVAMASRRPDRVVGFHFFNPAPVMTLVELVKTPVTDPEVVAAATGFARLLGKTPVVVNDRAGFVANLLLFPYLNQAVGMVQDGYATREDVDAAMKLGCGHPMGPLALMDLIGLDSANSIMERMYEQFGDVRYAPRPLVRQLLAAGFRGRKTGRGFYSYASANSRERQTGSGRLLDHGAEESDTPGIEGWTSVGVVGTGTMASGIAEVCALAGYQVVVRGRSAEKADATVEQVQESTGQAVERGKLDASERTAALGRIRATVDLAALAGCDVVVEAVVEDLNIKRALFAELDAAVGKNTLLATTTSSLPVIECAMATSRPERVLGVHFFNPANRMRLVEVVDTVRTSPAALAQANGFVERIGKHPARCADRAGFIVNALLFPYLNDAVKMLEQGYATSKDIDAAMKLGCGHPMGPFELMDVVGLDVTLEVCRALHAEFREQGFAPADLLGHMVSAGYLGRKTGRGFHVYA